MKSPAICIGLLTLTLCLGCEPAPRPNAATGTPPPAVPLVHDVFGVPGPWWRPGSSPDDFDADLRACRRASGAARQRAEGVDPLDAAYRAFLACMEERGWKRGIPPQPGLQGARGPTE